MHQPTPNRWENSPSGWVFSYPRHFESALLAEHMFSQQRRFENLKADASFTPLCSFRLASMRIRLMRVVEINNRLLQRFRPLTGSLRVALPRQQTLQALMDWSYDWLEENQRALLTRLSVLEVEGDVAEFTMAWEAGQAMAVEPSIPWYNRHRPLL